MSRFLAPIIILILILGIALSAITSNFITDYIAEKNSTLAWNSDFKEVWNVNLNDTIVSTPIVDKNIIYAQTQSETLVFDTNTQRFIWKIKIGGDIKNCPLIKSGEVLFIPSTKGKIFAVNENDGSAIWNIDLSTDGSNEFIEDIKADENYVFVALFNDSIYSIRASDGKIMWQHPAPSRVRLFMDLSSDMIILLGDQSVIAFDKLSGKTIWARDLEGGILDYKRWNNNLYLSVLGDSQSLVAIDIQNGEPLWNYNLPISRADCISAYDGKLLLSGDGLMEFDINDKKTIWQNSDINTLSCPIVFNNKILVRKRTRNLYIFFFNNGALESRYPLSWFTPYSLQRSVDPVIINDLVLVPSSEKTLSAIEE